VGRIRGPHRQPDVSPSSIGSAEAFGSPIVAGPISVGAGIASAEGFGSPTVTPDVADWSTVDHSFATGVTWVGASSSKVANSQRTVVVYDQGGTSIRRQVSNNEGATYGSEVVVDAAPGTVNGLDTAAINDTDELVVWLSGNTLRARRVLNGTPGAAIDSGITFAATPNGVACEYLAPHVLVIVTGEVSSKKGVFATYFDWSGASWAPAGDVRTIIDADNGLDVDYIGPHVDTNDGETKVTFVERYTGSGAFVRTLQAWLALGGSASSERYSQARPIVDSTSNFGVAVAGDPLRGGTFWSRADQVYRSPAVGGRGGGQINNKKTASRPIARRPWPTLRSPRPTSKHC
jgi:hypothetical protein